MTPKTHNSLEIRYFIVATNQYIDFARDLINSMKINSSDKEEFNFTIFTNEKSSLLELNRLGIEITIVEIPNLGWPDATLARYELISSVVHDFKEDVFCYIDADMIADKNLNCEIRNALKIQQDSFFAVSHPGYWRGSALNSLPTYLRHPKLILSDSLRFFRLGGIGAWETNEESQAFVARGKRAKYVAGGLWFAKSRIFANAVTELASQVEKDRRDKEIVAIWHDESHLNSWITKNRVEILDPSWCFSPEFPFLRKLVPKVLAVSKGENFVRR
jgi:hypothetical protein